MAAELLGYKIYRKSDFKPVMYIGKSNRKELREAKEVFPKSKFLWVDIRDISSPKTSMYRYKG